MAAYITTTRRTSNPTTPRDAPHLEGVITDSGIHYTRKEVVDSISAGNTWKTSADGYSATIHKLSYCPRGACLASPYIATNPDSTKKDNLENLPEG
jgi:hypothetical protein